MAFEIIHNKDGTVFKRTIREQPEVKAVEVKVKPDVIVETKVVEEKPKKKKYIRRKK